MSNKEGKNLPSYYFTCNIVINKRIQNNYSIILKKFILSFQKTNFDKKYHFYML